MLQSMRLRHVLLSLLVEDSNGVGRPVAFGVMNTYTQTRVEQFLNFFSENNDIQATEVMVTDKAVAEMNTVWKCWPNCQPMICHFHIMTSLNQFARSCEFSAEDRKQCAEVRALVNVVPCYAGHDYSRRNQSGVHLSLCPNSCAVATTYR